MDISLISEFDTIAKHGNLTEAARELHTSQAALSRHLSSIERELGAEVFDRSTSPMELTPMGEMLLRESSVINVEWNRIQRLAKAIRSSTPSTVSIACVQSARFSELMRLVKQTIATKEWAIRVKHEHPQYQTSFECLRDTSIDLCIEPLTMNDEADGLVHTHIFYEDAALVVEAKSDLSTCACMPVSDLPGLAFTNARSNAYHAVCEHVLDICRLYGDGSGLPHKFRHSTTATTYDDLFFEGLDGYAVLLPASLAARYVNDGTGNYVAVPVTGDGAPYDFHAFHLPNADRAVRQLADLLVEVGRQAGELQEAQR